MFAPFEPIIQPIIDEVLKEQQKEEAQSLLSELDRFEATHLKIKEPLHAVLAQYDKTEKLLTARLDIAYAPYKGKKTGERTLMFEILKRCSKNKCLFLFDAGFYSMGQGTDRGNSNCVVHLFHDPSFCIVRQRDLAKASPVLPYRSKRSDLVEQELYCILTAGAIGPTLLSKLPDTPIEWGQSALAFLALGLMGFEQQISSFSDGLWAVWEHVQRAINLNGQKYAAFRASMYSCMPDSVRRP